MEKDLKIIKQVFEEFNSSLKKNITDSTEFKKHILLVEATLELLRNELNTNDRFIKAQCFKNSFEILDIKAFRNLIDSKTYMSFIDTTDTENFNLVKDIAVYAIYTLINIAAKKVKKEKNNE